jgi:RNA-directed DNA polymerase
MRNDGFFATSSHDRYSDDLVFSSIDTFDRRRASGIIAHVRSIVEDQSLRLHRKKTRIVPPGARQVVLGLLVGDHNVRLLPEFRRGIEVYVRGVKRYGLSNHASHRQFDSIFSLVDHVDGCIAFAASVDPAFANQMRHRWNDALLISGYPAGAE